MTMLLEDDTGFCPWHKRDSSFQMVQYINYAAPQHYSTQFGSARPFDPPKDVARASVLVYECLHCSKSMILVENTYTMPSSEPNGDDEIRKTRRMVWPSESPRALHNSAPEALRSLFAEASTCEKAKVFRAAGVMYRATVEELVKDQGATGRDLWHKIESLKFTLSDELVKDRPKPGCSATTAFTRA